MIGIRTKKEIALMRESGTRLARALQKTQDAVQVGATLRELDIIAEHAIVREGGELAFKNYRQSSGNVPFPATLCASLNHEIVHAPATRDIVLREGDVLSLDLGLSYKGWFTDMAVTIPIGRVTDAAQKLITVTEEALDAGVMAVKPGDPLIVVSNAIYNIIKQHGYGVVTGFCGHGVGKKVHEEPMIPNYPTPLASRVIMRPGMTLALEPMVTLGDPQFTIADDGWTAYTNDKSIAAHFEKTVLVTERGVEVLTTL